MVHRDRKKGQKPVGSLVLDLVTPVGRIKRASGTNDPRVLARYKKTLHALAGDPSLWPYLRAARSRKGLKIAVIHEHYITGRLAELAIGAQAQPLVETFRAWAKTYECSDDHRDSLEVTARYFAKAMPAARVADIPAITEALRGTLGKKHPRSFNLLRSHAQAFVRDTLKRSHPLWLALQAIQPVKVKAQRAGRPLAPEEMRTLFPNPYLSALDGMAWTMATTGMHQKEYWGTWERQLDRIHIAGTKRKGRERDVPLVHAPDHPSMHQRTFENKVRARGKAHDLKITVYDFRRTYANWMEEARVTRTRRRLYLGHGARDVTDLYEKHEVTAFLRSDAKKLKAFIDPKPAPNIQREAK